MNNILMILAAVLESSYLLLTLVIFFFIFYNKNETKLGYKFWNKVEGLLLTSFIGHPLIGYFMPNYLENITFRLSIYSEIFFVVWIFNKTISKKITKSIFSILMLVSIFLLPKTHYEGKLGLNADFQLFYTIESILISTMAVLYFFELRPKLSEKNLLSDTYTLIIIGIFFCFFIPINYNLAYFIYVKNQNIDYLEELNTDKMSTTLLLLNYILTRFSMVILTIFLYRAVKADLEAKKLINQLSPNPIHN